MRYTQKTEEYTLKLPNNLTIDLNKIDQWLRDVLKITIEPFDRSIDENLSDDGIQIYQFSWRVLLFSRVLLQAVKVPVFDTGRIVEIKSGDTNEYIITLRIVSIENIPKQLSLAVVSNAINILLNFMKKDHTSQNIQELFNIIQTQIITPFINKAGSGKSTLPILEAAHKLDIPFTHLTNGIYQLGWGGRARQLNRSIIDSDSAIGSQMSQNKTVTAMLLRKGGLPAPEHILATSKDEALAAVKKFGWPLVVKPSDQDRGEGVTVDIRCDESLIKAFIIAHDISPSKEVIVEKQVDGVCCRVFIANNKLLYSVKRVPKSVKGDGLSSVKELIDEANQLENITPMWLRSEPFPNDTLAIEAINNAGFTMDSIPNKDQYVPLRRIESTQWGGVDEDISKIIHPANLDIALRASRLFGLKVAGIDIITSDISIPWYKNGAIINEVNFSPLLGGGDISKRMIPTFLKEFVIDDGRIPVTVIIGDKSGMDQALKIQKEHLVQNLKCFISSHKKTICFNGEEIYFTMDTLNQRCEALLFDKRVDSLILVVQTDEFLHKGLPVDKIDKIITATEDLYAWNNNDVKLQKTSFNQIMKLLKTVNI